MEPAAVGRPEFCTSEEAAIQRQRLGMRPHLKRQVQSLILAARN